MLLHYKAYEKGNVCTMWHDTYLFSGKKCVNTSVCIFSDQYYNLYICAIDIMSTYLSQLLKKKKKKKKNYIMEIFKPVITDDSLFRK